VCYTTHQNTSRHRWGHRLVFEADLTNSGDQIHRRSGQPCARHVAQMFSGSMPLRLAVPTSEYIAAARSPPQPVGILHALNHGGRHPWAFTAFKMASPRVHQLNPRKYQTSRKSHQKEQPI
jgi:hypothetical protein